MNMIKKCKVGHVKSIPCPSSINIFNGREKAIAAEPTGRGNTLIIDGFFGRMFRDDIDCVKQDLEDFSNEYDKICRMLDEDPARRYFEVMSYNDLYAKHGIIPGIAQGMWGWTNSQDYRVNPIVWDTRYIEDGEWFDIFGEPYFYYCPREYCFPDPNYMEV